LPRFCAQDTSGGMPAPPRRRRRHLAGAPLRRCLAASGPSDSKQQVCCKDKGVCEWVDEGYSTSSLGRTRKQHVYVSESERQTEIVEAQ
jgi:hypothetical protein